MQIQVTVDIDSRIPAGWARPADADDIAGWLKNEWEGLDVEDEGFSFQVTNIDAKVLAP